MLAGGHAIPDLVRHYFFEYLERKAGKNRYSDWHLRAKRYLSQHFGECARLLSKLAEESAKAMLSRVDLRDCTASYEICKDFEKVREILDHFPDFERDESDPKPEDIGAIRYHWLRHGGSRMFEKFMPAFFRHAEDGSQGVGTLGNVRLYPDRLVVQAFSKQKFEFAKKMTRKYFGSRLRLESESVIDLAKQMADRAGQELVSKDEEPAQKLKPASIPRDVEQELMRCFYRKHYESFLDDHIPVLRGFTPREASQDPELRPLLLDLMKDHITGLDRQGKEKGIDLNIDWVLEELGLGELMSPRT
jgi:hypothetical protein